MEQRTQEWHEARKGKITGSRIGAIMGLSNFANRDDVMREMVRAYFDAEKEFKGNIATEYGVKNEPLALAEFIRDHQENVIHEGFREKGFCGVSPDGLLLDFENKVYSGIEIKCPFSKKIKKGKAKDQYPSYYAQVQLSMYVYDVKTWGLYTWTESGSYYELIHRDQQFINNILDIGSKFHEEYLQIISDENLYKPYLDDLEIIVDNDDEFEKMASEFLELKRQKKDIEKTLAIIEAYFKDYAKQKKSKKLIGSGVQVILAERKGSVDYKKMADVNGINVEEYRANSTEYYLIKEHKG